MRIKNEYVVTEIDKILNRLLAQIYPNFDFISGMWVNLENEENRAQMVKGLEKHPGVNHVQVIGGSALCLAVSWAWQRSRR